jgi:response regulator RpfG family c-di-GMP phosphodiesterase
MKLMVIDRDRDSVEQIEKICAEIGGIDLTVEPIKNNAVELLRADKFDGVLFDPAPQNNELRAFMIGVRRGNPHYTPLTVMSHLMSHEDVTGMGANDFLAKPLNSDALKVKIENLKRLSDLSSRLSDEQEDFPSRDGIISKSAFNQIFISSLDRADRYGEETYLTFASIANIDEIRATRSDEAALEICDNLKKYTMRIRRLSDIAGRTAPHEICLMLMRPANAEEPKMAIKRFSDSMSEYAELISSSDTKAVVRVEMVAIPSGEVTFSQEFG